MSDAPKSFEGIMVSSTFSDLKAHRQEVMDAISRLGFHPVVMEYSGASDADVITKSLQMVRDCSVYVLIISHKYGQTPKDPRNPDRLSITELEFNEAVRLGLPRLLFLMADDHVLLKDHVELSAANRRKLKNLKERAKRSNPDAAGTPVHCVWEAFASKEQLGTAAAIAVAKYFMDRDRARQSAAPEPQLSSKEVAALLEAARDLAQQRSVGTEALIALARRVAENVSEPEMAEAQLHRALDEFAELRAKAEQGSNLGDLVDDTMRALSRHNERGDLDAGAKAIEWGIETLCEREAELKAGQARLIDAAIEQHRLRFDVEAVTRWLCEKCGTDQGTLTASVLFNVIGKWRELGQKGGLRFELEVACALAQESLRISVNDVEIAASLNWISLTLLDAGELTSGSRGIDLINRAAEASKNSLSYLSKDKNPFQWAGAQNNLCNALRLKAVRSPLGVRMKILHDARLSGSEALKVWTKENSPYDWASAHNNVATIFQCQAEMRNSRERLESLENAITGYIHALIVWTEKQNPHEWSTAKNNLGIVLSMKGSSVDSANGLKLLFRAIDEFNHALIVRNKGDRPAFWAMTRENMALCYSAIAERSHDPLPQWRAAEQAVRDALQVYTPEQMGFFHEKATRLLDQILAEIAKLGG